MITKQNYPSPVTTLDTSMTKKQLNYFFTMIIYKIT